MKLQTLSLAAIVMLAGCSAQGDTASQQRASIQKMRSETLNKLYALQPEARSDIQHAKGYAVFAKPEQQDPAVRVWQRLRRGAE
ncbi:lipid-binding SYLF domain-containing protein [Klebsiella variicola]|uniref:hypothetical protein n=1 Tax=Klebsiella variicola TaxID=244366 RepID=UPI001E60E28F|nr:hypothetical protein [Klebsiella variicola]